MGISIKFLCMVYGCGFSIAALVFILLRSTFAVYRCRAFTVVYWGVGLMLAGCGLAVIEKLDNIFTSAMMIRLLVIWLLTQLALAVIMPFIWAGQRLLQTAVSQCNRPADESRRGFIKMAALGVPGTVLGVNGYGSWNAANQLDFNERELAFGNLAAELDGYKIAQLSDVHLGLFFSLDRLEQLLDDIVVRQPDILVITGDFIDDINMVQDMAAILDKYYDKFPQGIWFIWGNHEYFRDFTRIEQALKGTRVKILRNSHALLKNAARPLYLLGVDYPWERSETARAAECQSMLDEAMTGVPHNATKVLLTHHPAIIDNAFAADIDLTLAGHTHGGQIEIFGVCLLPASYKYLRGLYEENGAYAYVNNGAGSWFPIRLGCPAEVTMFILRSI